IIDADVLARIVVEPGKPAWRNIARTFGGGVLRPDRSLDRAALARIVFRDRRKLKALGAIVHPRVAREQQARARAIGRRRPRAVIIYDAPVLIEAGAHRRMDRLIVVTADRRTQIGRLRRRNGLTAAEAVRRVGSQMPLTRKVKLADYVVDGTKPRAALRADVRRIYGELKELARTRLVKRSRSPSSKAAGRAKTGGVPSGVR
ncbi:MAG TPA: dephospho-CoA kinase, partial [Nitrospirales bacterium]|nr:dephospho-CoA kinase [Nitrospirales bacterium]